MIDLSDGLASDIRRINEESNVGAVLYASKIPVSAAAHTNAKKTSKTPLNCSLTDGEDFELLFTIPKNEVDSLVKKWKKKFTLRLTHIGEITKAKEIIINLKGKQRSLEAHGYDHFA